MPALYGLLSNQAMYYLERNSDFLWRCNYVGEMLYLYSGSYGELQNQYILMYGTDASIAQSWEVRFTYQTYQYALIGNHLHE